MYTKAGATGTLALTPGITWAQTGSIVLAGAALLVVGVGFLLASRLRRRHDDDMVG